MVQFGGVSWWNRLKLKIVSLMMAGKPLIMNCNYIAEDGKPAAFITNRGAESVIDGKCYMREGYIYGCKFDGGQSGL